MDISGIEAFLTIIESQSISNAAEKLFLSQSTVSHRLDILEEELGLKLIKRYRGKRFITLTPKGEEFIIIAKQWMALKKDTEIWVKQETITKLNIASVDSLNAYVFPQLYRDIILDKNQLTINISSHWSKTIFNLIESYEVDIGLVPRLIKTNNLISEPIFSEELVLISNSRISEFSSLVHPQDLDVKKEIFLDWGPDFQIWHNNWWDPKESIEVSADTAGLILNFIDIPQSWAIVTESVAYYFEKSYPIKISKLKFPPPSRLCYTIKHRTPLTSSNKALTIFEKYLKEFVNNNPFLTQISKNTN